MKSNDLNDKIYKFILKERSFKFHLITTILTCGIWCFLYFSIKLSYIYNTQKCTFCKNRIYKSEIICPYCGKVVEITDKEDAQNRKWLEKKYGIEITSHSYSAPNPYTNAVPYEVYQYAYSKNKSKEYPNDYVVFDTETTGLEPEIDKIIEISAIKYINGEPVDYFSELINPLQKLDPFITKLTGIKDNDLSDKPTIDKILPLFFDFIEDFVLIAHNTPFDIKMIACEAYRSNIDMVNNKLVDTVLLAKRMIPEYEIKNYKLSTLKEYFGIDIKSHRATEDCEMCNIVYQQYLKFSKIKNKNKQLIIIDKETGEVLQEN